MLESQLRKIGLSDKEARVYLASLQLGKSPAQEIAKQSGVNRATTYVILESLKDRGLISSYEQSEKTFFVAETPERLIFMVNEEVQRVSEKKQTAATILPELLSLYGSVEHKPKVKFYEGVEGLYSIQEEYLKVKSKQIHNVSNMDGFLRHMPNVTNEYTPRRIKKGIQAQLICVAKDKPCKSVGTSKKELRETKHIRAEEFAFNVDMTVFDNKVAIESYEGKPMAVLIEDKNISSSMKAIFDFLWKHSEWVDKKD